MAISNKPVEENMGIFDTGYSIYKLAAMNDEENVKKESNICYSSPISLNLNLVVSIDIKYFSNEISKLDYVDGKSDWIDVRSATNIILKKGEFALIPLGFAMKLPDGYEAHLLPRSSTYKKWGIIQPNHLGVIDNSYCGDNDEWKYPALCLNPTDKIFIKEKGIKGFFKSMFHVKTRCTSINVGDRIAQFRIVKNQPHINFNTVDHLSETDRGGFGSTGTN